MATHIPSTGTHARERSRFAFGSTGSPPPIIAAGGPVSMALRAMRAANDLPPQLARQFDGERLEIQNLRAVIGAQIEADLSRIDRCLVVLDALDGTEGHEDDEDGADDEPSFGGPIATAAQDECESYGCGHNLDDEPSLGWPDGRDAQRFTGGGEDLERDTADAEPSLGSFDAREDQTGWGKGSRSDREHDEAERGVADLGGMYEQICRFVEAGGDMNRRAHSA